MKCNKFYECTMREPITYVGLLCVCHTFDINWTVTFSCAIVTRMVGVSLNFGTARPYAINAFPISHAHTHAHMPVDTDQYVYTCTCKYCAPPSPLFPVHCTWRQTCDDGLAWVALPSIIFRSHVKLVRAAPRESRGVLEYVLEHRDGSNAKNSDSRSVWVLHTYGIGDVNEGGWRGGSPGKHQSPNTQCDEFYNGWVWTAWRPRGVWGAWGGKEGETHGQESYLLYKPNAVIATGKLLIAIPFSMVVHTNDEPLLSEVALTSST